MSQFAPSVSELSPAAIGVMGQLFVHGPTWDGNIITKVGRSELVKAGLATHAHGWAWLTEDGLVAALEFGKAASSPVWKAKAGCR